MSASPLPDQPALHVAIIMDGSGRWAEARGLPRSDGHRAGVQAVRRVVGAAGGLGIGTLTLHAFSSDNWRRPREEVAELLRIFRAYLESDTPAWITRGVRLSVLGRRDRLPPELTAAIETAEAATRSARSGRLLNLQLVIDYSGRDAILGAMRGALRKLNSPPLSTSITCVGLASQSEFSRLLAEGNHLEGPSPDVDLLIRTGGEQRLSDFLLWEIAYAELIFTKRLWPDYDDADLEAAIKEFHSRERRFGRLPQPVAV